MSTENNVKGTVPVTPFANHSISKEAAMADKKKNGFPFRKDKENNSKPSADNSRILKNAQKAGEAIGNKAMEIKGSAMSIKEDITDKLTELDRMLETSITEYNDAYTLMNDRGLQLFIERTRSVDTIEFVETLVNSIANKPKSFDAEFEEINTNRDSFRDSCDFGMRELQAARAAAGGAGAGLAAGASVAFMAPTAAMWVATTFGTASTGTAISALSGAAAESAALAWLGGGALSAGGGGIVAGKALLAMAGPIGWSIAGASLLTSIVLFSKRKARLNKEKNEEIEAVKQNTERVREVDAQIKEVLTHTFYIRTGVNSSYTQNVELFGKDYTSFNDNQKKSLGAMVNQTKALSAMLGKTIS